MHAADHGVHGQHELAPRRWREQGRVVGEVERTGAGERTEMPRDQGELGGKGGVGHGFAFCHCWACKAEAIPAEHAHRPKERHPAGDHMPGNGIGGRSHPGSGPKPVRLGVLRALNTAGAPWSGTERLSLWARHPDFPQMRLPWIMCPVAAGGAGNPVAGSFLRAVPAPPPVPGLVRTLGHRNGATFPTPAAARGTARFHHEGRKPRSDATSGAADRA